MKYALWALAFFLIDAQATYIDLTGSEVVAKAQCTRDKKVFNCVLVEYKDSIYVVILDSKGEYEIYQVTEEGSTLIWARDMV
jgi:hypothetical protein